MIVPDPGVEIPHSKLPHLHSRVLDDKRGQPAAPILHSSHEINQRRLSGLKAPQQGIVETQRPPKPARTGQMPINKESKAAGIFSRIRKAFPQLVIDRLRRYGGEGGATDAGRQGNPGGSGPEPVYAIKTIMAKQYPRYIFQYLLHPGFPFIQRAGLYTASNSLRASVRGRHSGDPAQAAAPGAARTERRRQAGRAGFCSPGKPADSPR